MDACNNGVESGKRRCSNAVSRIIRALPKLAFDVLDSEQ